MTDTGYAARVRASPWRAWYVAVRYWLEPFPLSLLQLGMRLAIGMTFLNSGKLKINSFDFAVRLFRDEYRLPARLFPEEYGIPVIDPVLAAQLATFVEVSVPMFLFAGLATRLATIPLLAMTAVIEFLVYPEAWPTHLMWASLLVLLLTRGPGFFSIDHVIETYVAGKAPFSRVRSFALVVGSLCLTLGLMIATFPQILLGAAGQAPIVHWSLLVVALAMFVVAHFALTNTDRETAQRGHS